MRLARRLRELELQGSELRAHARFGISYRDGR
jgi:hypothetical protein